MFIAIAACALAGAPDVSALRAAVLPKSADEPWLKIAWGADLWAARGAAAQAGKPILLWEMDGHPLGCT